MADFTVKRFGTDTSGRAVWMTAYMTAWWERVVAELGFRPTIVQGAFMTRDGGGAAASAGYHDQGGCIDVRIWDLTGSQVDALVRTCRRLGAAAWRRDKTPAHGGMDPHCHITLGTDRPLSAGAAESWRSYLHGGNGLAGNAPDYEWRPSPLITHPPEEDDMANYRDWSKADKQALADDIAAAVLRTKDVNNRDTEGELQKVVSLASIVSNMESGMDAMATTLNKIAKKVGA